MANKEKLDHVELVSSQQTNAHYKEYESTQKLQELEEIEFNGINERKTLRKLDIRIVPMVTILYLLSWLDRGYGFRFPRHDYSLI